MVEFGYVYLIGLMIWGLLGHRIPYNLRGWQSIICGFIAIGVPCFLMACYGYYCSTSSARWLWLGIGIYILLSYAILLPVVILAIQMQLRHAESPESSSNSVTLSLRKRLWAIALPVASLVGWYLTFGLTRG